MYASIWRKLPGPWPAKLIWSSALLVGSVALLFTVVFPWLEPRLPFNDVTVDDTTSGPAEPGPSASPGSTAPDGTVREITTPGDGPTVTPSVVGSPAPTST